MSSFGAPRKIEGIKSRKVCVIDIATINTTRIIGEIPRKIVVDADTRRTATRFMWMPGVKPVNVPAMMPITNAIANSKSILPSISEELLVYIDCDDFVMIIVRLHAKIYK